jgi:membrane-bound serine protease (ClpP class)
MTQRYDAIERGIAVVLVGIALLLAGAGLLVAEAHLPTYGALGLGGVVALVAGTAIAVDA